MVDVCEHGGLRRKCEPCELRAEVDHLHTLIESAHHWWESYAHATDEEKLQGLIDACAYSDAVAHAAHAERDHWIRLFNRLEAAVSHHKAGERFPDDHDERLWAARDRVLRDAGASPGREQRP